MTQTAFNPPLSWSGSRPIAAPMAIVKKTRSSRSTCSARAQRARPSPSSSRPQLEGGKLSGQAIHKAERRADPRRRAGGGRMQGHRDRRAGRPPHRRRRSRRGACAEADRGPPGRRDPRDEGPRRQRVLRRLSAIRRGPLRRRRRRLGRASSPRRPTIGHRAAGRSAPSPPGASRTACRARSRRG